MELRSMVPESWRAPLATELAKPYIDTLGAYLEGEYASQKVYPIQETDSLLRRLVLDKNLLP